jgi:hypothetical protein
MAAMFLRHEGFLGAVGAFLLVQPNILTSITASRRPTADLPGKVSEAPSSLRCKHCYNGQLRLACHAVYILACKREACARCMHF